jgi:hypothetical protein
MIAAHLDVKPSKMAQIEAITTTVLSIGPSSTRDQYMSEQEGSSNQNATTNTLDQET